MMTKTIYTEEQLLNFEDHGDLPVGVDLAPFIEMVAQVKETLNELDERFPKRKGFGVFHHTNRPRRKRQPKEVTGDDGWTSLLPKKHNQTSAESAAAEQEAQEEEEFEQVKSFKTNAAKISSGKTGSASSKDTVAIAHVSRFNAFDALNVDDEE
ncbi:hypothetical protein FOA43_001244 [Brettanomyces nanus]|uniref:Cap-associated protein CAF20 n=1 Tax=Eeniella nana TaxID=13502 RepID=A0A875S267_EENNA|nr:uncharacterized protein FOA43_001244 [Brettanomyces nanus]QPG73929.1 hypothetical protein FOA43_001244 [Brettanomyces nanus]